jgi:hypothetical protein
VLLHLAPAGNAPGALALRPTSLRPPRRDVILYAFDLLELNGKVPVTALFEGAGDCPVTLLAGAQNRAIVGLLRLINFARTAATRAPHSARPVI